MTLYDKITVVLFENGLSVTDFLEETEFSKGMFYSIKSGKKNILTPLQAKKIIDLYPKHTFEWLNDVSEKADYSGVREESKEYKTNSSIEDIIAKKILSEIKPILKEQDKKIDDLGAIMTTFVRDLRDIKSQLKKITTKY